MTHEKDEFSGFARPLNPKKLLELPIETKVRKKSWHLVTWAEARANALAYVQKGMEVQGFLLTLTGLMCVVWALLVGPAP